MEYRLAEKGIVAGSYDGCQMREIAAMLGANEPRDEGETVIANADPSEFTPPGWQP